jgi:phosphoribosylanthranilate isomerase
MFRVKICGITSVEDAVAAVDAGADAIGLNFYEQSLRYVDAERATEITGAVRTGAARVGVFVNKSPSEMEKFAAKVALSWLQLHGDETPRELAAVNDQLNVVRVRRMNDSYQQAVVSDIAACRAQGRGPSALMIDAMAPGQYGGSGMTVNWRSLVDHPHWLDTPLILAGGLTPDNVAEAIRIVRPAAVDVASGVESAPGKKDPVKVRDFVTNALGAFEALGRS